MARVSPIFIAVTVLQAAWGSALYAADDCMSLGIIGGRNSTIEEIPSAVSIRVKYDEFSHNVCGGVIVDERFILTAAMCLDRVKISQMTVRVGSTYLTRGGSYVQANTTIVHKEYDSESITNNLALIKLEKPILFGFLAKAKLPEKDDIKVGSEAVLSGWGATNVNETETDVFHQITIPIKAQKCCTNPDNSILNDANKICAGSPGHDACQGDGGSPLIQNGVLIGLQSYGRDDSCGKYPDVYTNVARYLDWIKNTIAENQ